MRIAVASGDRVTAEALRRAVLSDPLHSVAWFARDGAEAVALCLSDSPDVLLLDPLVPGVSAVELTRRVMKEAPCAILLVTPKGANVGPVYDALSLGALDVAAAPSMDLEGELSGHSPLLARLASVERLVVKRSPSQPLPNLLSPPVPFSLTSPAPLVAIGASTGGPAALATILERVPKDLAAAIVIVQHIDEGFAEGLASWLSDRTGFPVASAVAGDVPRAGRGYLAATGQHLVMAADRSLVYVSEPAEHLHKPSVDVFFTSLAASPSPGLALLLTGMGRDGADGLLKLRRAGWMTVAQDAKTSVVNGMPRAAVDLGAAELVLPVDAMASTISGFAARVSRRR